MRTWTFAGRGVSPFEVEAVTLHEAWARAYDAIACDPDDDILFLVSVV